MGDVFWQVNELANYGRTVSTMDPSLEWEFDVIGMGI